MTGTDTTSLRDLIREAADAEADTQFGPQIDAHAWAWAEPPTQGDQVSTFGHLNGFGFPAAGKPSTPNRLLHPRHEDSYRSWGEVFYFVAVVLICSGAIAALLAWGGPWALQS